MKYIKKFETKDLKLKSYSENPERETIHLNREILLELRRHSRTPKFSLGYTHIENRITGSDPEDGGADHVVIFKRDSDDTYFKFEYTDWDVEYNEEDFPTTATEVFPRMITKTIYE